MIPTTLRAGVLGCGNISDTYLSRARTFEGLEIVACADTDAGRAAAQAERYGVRGTAPDALLADPEVDIVINLTPPRAHATVGAAAIAAGKHLYSEKPLGVSLEEGRALATAARAAGVRLGCAPDTFLGGGHQLARKLVDEGAIGRPISGAIWFATRGMEHWHPDPAFFFQAGGGPILDIGAYYVTALVNLIGPVKRVMAIGTRGFAERLVTSEGPKRGTRLPVEVDTLVVGALEFACGAVVPLTATWDVFAETTFRLELYGSEGTMLLPDPNFFGGATRLSRGGAPFERVEPSAMAYARPNRRTGRGEDVADYRILGVVDLARAIAEGRPHRCSGDLALHVLEVLCAFDRSAREGRHVAIETPCERPAALSGGDLAWWSGREAPAA
ncbi:Gfo/Idh/MocA family protein [Salinarimonas ramus]|uniref:Oxidoreductase n=1 Tax=Salinarimonas ramus TaxID=690164 RepID=A0A917QAN7_9HYPH|nr:Gfo/Idh/MocA family oxidoreductase [Salinarimonas ramus]GGK39776.1 oxidoreductase [Salinarimonas ramus]